MRIIRIFCGRVSKPDGDWVNVAKGQWDKILSPHDNAKMEMILGCIKFVSLGGKSVDVALIERSYCPNCKLSHDKEIERLK